MDAQGTAGPSRENRISRTRLLLILPAGYHITQHIDQTHTYCKLDACKSGRCIDCVYIHGVKGIRCSYNCIEVLVAWTDGRDPRWIIYDEELLGKATAKFLQELQLPNLVVLHTA